MNSIGKLQWRQERGKVYMQTDIYASCVPATERTNESNNLKFMFSWFNVVNFNAK